MIGGVRISHRYGDIYLTCCHLCTVCSPLGIEQITYLPVGKPTTRCPAHYDIWTSRDFLNGGVERGR